VVVVIIPADLAVSTLGLLHICPIKKEWEGWSFRLLFHHVERETSWRQMNLSVFLTSTYNP